MRLEIDMVIFFNWGCKLEIGKCVWTGGLSTSKSATGK